MDENKLDLIFKAYDVRGVFNETITPKVGFKIGAAFASYVDSNEIIVGHDGRISNNEMFAAISSGIQSVNKKVNLRYHEMLTTFNNKYGCPVVVNTSFNVRGEPIVCTPKDAYLCFMRTEMDILVMQNQILFKSEQPISEKDETWMQEFELD